MKEEGKIYGWVTIDEDECLRFWKYPYKPRRASTEWFNNEDGEFFSLDASKMFKELKFTDDPVEVEITIKRL